MAPEPLNEAAARRHERTVARAERALRTMEADGTPISFQSIAQRAGVSRQWLYTQPDLRGRIEQLRDCPRASANPVPAGQRATEASLRQRLESTRAENQRLREENAALKDELAIAYGHERVARR